MKVKANADAVVLAVAGNSQITRFVKIILQDRSMGQPRTREWCNSGPLICITWGRRGFNGKISKKLDGTAITSGRVEEWCTASYNTKDNLLVFSARLSHLLQIAHFVNENGRGI